MRATWRSKGSDLKQLAISTARSHRVRSVQAGVTPAELVIVAGSPRSGTTWLAELVNHDSTYRYCFEPLEWHHRHRQFAGFHRLHYERPGSHDPSIAGPMRRLLAGRVFSPYSDGWDRSPLHRPRSGLLIKCIRMNLLLGWIAEHDPHSRLVVIARHPLSVIASRGSLSWLDWASDVADIDDLLDQDDLVADHLEPYLSVIRAASTPVERQLVMWCVEQLVPRRQLADRAHFVRYEDLLLRPEIEAPALFEAIGRPWHPAVLDQLRRPSRTAWNGDAFRSDRRHHAERWRGVFDDHERATARRILGDFGLSAMYTID